MSGVFDAQVQTKLAVPDPKTDWKLPVPGALAYSAITADSALAGTNGHDTLLLSGNRDRQMNGNESTRITNNRSHTVGGDQQKQITGNKNENVSGNFLQNTIGDRHRTVVGATHDLFTGAHTIAHKANQMLQEPVQYMHYIESKLQKGIDYYQAFGFYNSVIGNYFNVVGVNTDIKGVQLGMTGAAAENALARWESNEVKVKAAELETRLQGIEAQVGALEPAVYVSMVHEVAITQKIFIVGANQVI